MIIQSKEGGEPTRPREAQPAQPCRWAGDGGLSGLIYQCHFGHPSALWMALVALAVSL